MQTYAVYWSDPDGRRSAGCLALGASFVELHGATSDGRCTAMRIRFDEIASVRYERGRLHVWRRSGAPVSLGSVDKPGALWELAAELKSRLGGGTGEPVAVC